MKVLIPSLILLLLSTQTLISKENTKTQEYLDSLPKYEGSIDINPDTLKQKAGELNIDFLRDTMQESKEFENLQIEAPSMEYLDKAKEIKDLTNMEDFKKELKANEDYILYDKSIDFSKYTGLNREELESIRNGSHNLQSGNRFLSSDEKIFIVISSSMPKETIINYFKTLEKVNTDVTFILQGLVGNDISKLNPTLEYIRDLLVKDKNTSLENPENIYSFNIDINPKVTQKFNITHTPAVIFISNYDKTLQEPQELKESINGERVYIAYGAVSADYAFKEINKKAKSKGLEKLLAQLNKSFFTEQRSKE
ncbi:TrbC family F-type conjugative pilus assembly protein [Helicobacter apodemus]|uniref:Type-F conjugative transfer system pilin assembly protein TrbC n=1 Tax=Helicobacter apodemus TaxID=135569 RepID=A0A2U8FFF3_9HELI|nr:TrbC family F-type conjugative pilus assembly protein [Helicobacter apodemus]AWI34155.1 hypothetical protein CDV25_04785 [Helicobacter apodemus]